MTELTTERVCLALGYFDSVHIGHRRLLDIARQTARADGLPCAAVTFSNNAYKLFNSSSKQVYTYAERCTMLDKYCDLVLPLRFDTRLKNCPAQKFLDWLFSHYDIASVVCGYDHTFGAGAEGDAGMLAEYCENAGVKCVVVDKFELDGERVSTSAVKSAISGGDMEHANMLLGEPFFITAKVVRGRGVGRMFDIPTANLRIPASKLIPADGVYGTTCVIDGKTYRGATTVGSRPTFDLSRRSVETMIKDFNENIYGKEITVTFRKRLRDIIKFETPALLSRQVHKDIRWE